MVAPPSFLVVCSVLIPNRTFLVRFGGISGEFGRAMVRILARRNRAKIPMVTLNEPDMLLKHTKKVRLGIYRTQIRPKTRRYFFSYCARLVRSSSHLAREL